MACLPDDFFEWSFEEQEQFVEDIVRDAWAERLTETGATRKHGSPLLAQAVDGAQTKKTV